MSLLTVYPKNILKLNLTLDLQSIHMKGLTRMNATTSPALERILGWLPAWLGFVLIIAAGAASIIFGAMDEVAGLISVGAWAVVSAVIAWVSGATSSPRVNPFKRSFGGVASEIPQVAWLVIAGLFVIALVLAFVL